MKKLVPVFIASLFLLVSCEKINEDDGEGCQPNADQIQITTNSPVVVGWPLTLETIDDMSYLYKWTGPNGFNIDYNYHSSEAYYQWKPSVSYADSGLYTVMLRSSDGCIQKIGTVRVEVIDAPVAPCNVPNNTTTSSVVGVGGSTYSPAYASGSGGVYDVHASGGGETITMRFNGDAAPIPGIYKSSGAYFALEDGQAGIFINAGMYSFVMHPDFDIYVTRVNGKLQISFCNTTFSNPLGSTPIVISGKLTAQ